MSMNDLLERYLGAVCSYFLGPKRHRVYTDLKEQKNEEIQIVNHTITLKPLSYCQFITIYVK